MAQWPKHWSLYEAKKMLKVHDSDLESNTDSSDEDNENYNPMDIIDDGTEFRLPRVIFARYEKKKSRAHEQRIRKDKKASTKKLIIAGKGESTHTPNAVAAPAVAQMEPNAEIPGVAAKTDTHAAPPTKKFQGSKAHARRAAKSNVAPETAEPAYSNAACMASAPVKNCTCLTSGRASEQTVDVPKQPTKRFLRSVKKSAGFYKAMHTGRPVKNAVTTTAVAAP